MNRETSSQELLTAQREFLEQAEVAESLRTFARYCIANGIDVFGADVDNVAQVNRLDTGEWLVGQTAPLRTDEGVRETDLCVCFTHILEATRRDRRLFPEVPGALRGPWFQWTMGVTKDGTCSMQFRSTAVAEPDQPITATVTASQDERLHRLLNRLKQCGIRHASASEATGEFTSHGMEIYLQSADPANGLTALEREELEEEITEVVSALIDLQVPEGGFRENEGGRIEAQINVESQSVDLSVWIYTFSAEVRCLEKRFDGPNPRPSRRSAAHPA